jgi:hypothetical protein
VRKCLLTPSLRYSHYRIQNHAETIARPILSLEHAQPKCGSKLTWSCFLAGLSCWGPCEEVDASAEFSLVKNKERKARIFLGDARLKTCCVDRLGCRLLHMQSLAETGLVGYQQGTYNMRYQAGSSCPASFPLPFPESLWKSGFTKLRRDKHDPSLLLEHA